MAEHEEHSDEQKDTEREETVQDLDVSQDDSEDVRGGAARDPGGAKPWKE